MIANKFIIGVTGGIGAGKSRVSSYLAEQCGAFFLSADKVGHELMQPGKALYKVLLETYGKTVLNPDGSIHTGTLAEIAFRTKASQKKINELEHPIIKESILRRIRATKKKTVVLEAALLEEGRLTDLCDRILYVYAEDAIRIKRLMESRRYSLSKCRSIIKKQKSHEEFLLLSDATIDNSRDFATTEKAIRILCKKWKVERAL